MNGELAQTVVLTSYGNAYLHDARRVSREIVEHVAFQHTKSIQFGSGSAFYCVTAFRKWMQTLKRSNTIRLWLTDGLVDSCNLGAHNAEAFSNANPRGIITQHNEDNNRIWIPNWRCTRGSKWLVTYNCYQAPALPKSQNLSTVKNRLTKAIVNAKDFAAGKYQCWVDWFHRSLDTLETKSDSNDWFPSLGYSSLSRQLMAGAAAAWVFGGMGSWNDLWFEDAHEKETYSAVTDSLYSSVCAAILASTNSFDGQHTHT